LRPLHQSGNSRLHYRTNASTSKAIRALMTSTTYLAARSMSVGWTSVNAHSGNLVSRMRKWTRS